MVYTLRSGLQSQLPKEIQTVSQTVQLFLLPNTDTEQPSMFEFRGPIS